MTVKQTERRTYGTAELRVSDSSRGPRITGLAAAYGVLSEPLGFGRERLVRGAFTKVLASKPDTVALWNHDRNSVLGRTPDTLRLWETDAGLHFEVTLPETQLAQELTTLIRRGDVRGCSFAFTVKTERWLTSEGGEAIREVTEIGSLDDVSVVLRPAYTSTSVQARRLEEAAARHRKPLSVAECRRKMAEQDARLGLRLPARSGHAAAATAPSQVRADLEALRARRARLATRAQRDVGVRWRTELADRAGAARRAEGNVPGAIMDRGVLVAPE